MIKLVATDIDGTIFIPEKEFTSGVKNCIKKLDALGIKVILVTGRMNAAATRIAQDLGLNTPVVSYQGGLVVESGKTLYERYLTEEQTERILDWAGVNGENIHINLYNDDVLYSETDCYEVQRYCNNLHISMPFRKPLKVLLMRAVTRENTRICWRSSTLQTTFSASTVRLRNVQPSFSIFFLRTLAKFRAMMSI